MTGLCRSAAFQALTKIEPFARNCRQSIPAQPEGSRSMPNPVDVQIGRRIRTLRQSRFVSEEFLAGQIGVTSQQVRKYERGACRVSIRRLLQIAEVLEADVSVFFNGIQRPGVGNDNLPSLQLMTKQGLALLKLFHSIQDPQLRYQALRSVEAIAAASGSQEP
jgi:transcriptional regulator with XRE-family HTH domain